MGTQVDDLTIKLQGDIKGAEHELDKLIGKIGELSDKVANIGSKSSGSITKSFASIDLGGAKSKFDKFQSYVDKAASDMAKKLTIDFEVKDENAKKRIAELSQMLVKERAQASKMSAEGVGAGFDAEKIGKELERVIVSAHNVRRAAAEGKAEWQDFYDMLKNYSGKINVGDDGLKEMRHVLGEWKHLDGLIHQKFSSKEGLSISTIFDDFDSALGGQLQRLADSMDNSFDNKEKKIKAVVEALRLFREEIETPSKETAENISYGVWDVLIDKLWEVDRTARETFKSIDSRIAGLRAEVGDAGKEFATEGSGRFLNTVDKINEKIEKLQAHINDVNDKAALKEPDSTVWQNYQKEIIRTENMISSLQEKLDGFNVGNVSSSIEKFNRATDKAIERMYAAEAAQKAVNYEAQQSVAKEDTFGDYKAYDNAIKQFNELIKASKGAVEGTVEFQQSLARTRVKLDDLRNNPLEKYNLVKPREEFVDLANKIDIAAAKLHGFSESMSKGFATNRKFAKTREFEQIKYDAESTRREIVDLIADLDRLGDKTHEINFDSFGNSIKGAFSSTLNIVHKIGGAFSSLARTISGKVSSAFKKLTSNLFKTNDISKRLVKSFMRVGNMLRLMITRMALRGVINEAKQSFTELTQFSDKVADNFNKLRNAIKYLADTLAALVAPIFKTSSSFAGIGYIIDSITDKIVDLINKFNQLLSALLGHNTWIKATKQTKDYTKEVDKAGKAAKKALQPFDELNNLTTNDSGGGNDTGTGGSQFSELPIDPKWKNIAKWLKDMWKKGDFTELGAYLGARLRDALNSIPWGKIQNTARKIASSLATLLNGFFRTEGLAKAIGNTIAQAINTGLIFAEEFIKKFDFAAFGKFIGDAIVSAIKGIQWQRFIDACKALGKGIATAINSLVNTGVISEIGKAIGKILLGAIEFAFNLITNIDFDKLASEIANGIKNFLGVLGAVDKETGLTGWEKLGKTISDALLGLLNILNTTLGDKEIRKQISDGITGLLNQIDFAEIIKNSATLIGNIAKGLASVIIAAFKSEELRKGIVAGIPYVAAIFGAQLAGKGLLKLGATVGKKLLQHIGLSIINGLPELGASISAAVGSTAVTVVGSIAAVIAAAIGGMSFGKWIGSMIFPDDAELYEHYAGISGTFEMLGDFFTTLAERIQERWQELKAWFAENMPYFSELVSRIANAIKDTATKAAVAIKEELSKELNAIKEGFSRLKDKASEVLTAIKIVFGTIFTNIKEDIVTKVENIKTNISNAFNFIKSLIEGGSEIIVGVIDGNLIAIYQGFTKCFDSIKNYITNFINNAKSWGSQFVNNFKSAFDNFGILSFGGVGQVAKKILHLNADGGIYVNHRWKQIQGYAGGGQPKSAEMFLARENGAPELVGKMGSHTAVANNDQIVASVADGVYRAVVSAMAASGGNNKMQVEIIPDTSGIFKVVQREGNDYQQRTGRPVFA